MIKKEIINKTIKIVVLIAISILYIDRSFKEFDEPYVKGDSWEYVVMTSAFCSHYSPDITAQDMTNFREGIEKQYNWNNFNLHEQLSALENQLKNSKNIYKDQYLSLYCNKNQKWIFHHFFFYSLINVPAYIIFERYGPLRSFYFTNAVLIVITCFFLLFFTPFSLLNQIMSALCFCFSCCYWYLGWQHPEVYTSCLVALSLVALFNNKNYLAMVLLALACLQNQPLIILFALYSLITLFDKKFTIKNCIIICAIGLIAIIPPLYYYLNFETTNLIKDAGFLDKKYITLNRVTGFYFDYSQGMILTIPLILITYLILIINEIQKIIRKKIKFNFFIFIPIALIMISITVSSMGNWNHGMAIINRYETWVSIIIMIHTFYLVNNLKNIIATTLFVLFFISQISTTLYYQKFNKYDWSSAEFTHLAKWILNNHPNVYDPDPVIFAGRTRPKVELSETNSPIIYFHQKIPKKILVHRMKIDSLIYIGVTPESLKEIKEKIHYNFDWGYVDMDYFKTTLEGEKIYMLLRQKKLNTAYATIRGSSTWMADVERKAREWGKTVEEVCRMDAEYTVSQVEKEE